jgi:(1->4)-alpha-D-glucan 1-alpha-D-glucosylmutase
MLNSLSQTTLKLTCPGVPDIYQGTELWDFSFVDPDNRRRVDFDARLAIFNRLADMPDAESDRSESVAALRENWHDGAIKMFLIRELVALRNRFAHVFTGSGYHPLEVSGPQAERVFAFARSDERKTIVVAVTRLFAGITPSGARLPPPATWSGTLLSAPDDLGRSVRDVLTGRRLDVIDGVFGCDRLFSILPVAVLEATH